MKNWWHALSIGTKLNIPIQAMLVVVLSFAHFWVMEHIKDLRLDMLHYPEVSERQHNDQHRLNGNVQFCSDAQCMPPIFHNSCTSFGMLARLICYRIIIVM